MADMEIKLLITKRESYFTRMQTIYAAIPKSSREQKSLFLLQAANIDSLRAEFVQLVDQINCKALKSDPKYVPSFETLWSFDDLYYAVKSAYDKYSDAGVSVAVPSSSAIKLPQIEIPDFNGDIRKFPVFIETFNTIVHYNTSLTDSQRIQYLISKLKGASSSLCVGITGTGDNYKVLYDAVMAKYHDPRAIAISYLDAILNLKPLSGKMDPDSLELFIDQFSTSVAALKQLNIKDLAEFIFVHLGLRKLDAETSRAFEMSLENGNSFPKYDHFVSFIRDQAKVLQRTMNTTAVNSRPVRGLPPSNKNDYLTANRPKQTFLVNNTRPACSYCNSNKHLNLYQCEAFTRLSPTEKFNVIKKCNGCVNCLSVRHTLSLCKSTIACKICNKFHHTQLCRFGPGGSNQGNCRAHWVNSGQGQALPSMSRVNHGIAVQKPAISTEPERVPESFSGAATSQHNSRKTVILGTAIVPVLDGYGNRRDVRVLLDLGSQNHFVTSRCLRTLGIKIQPDNKNTLVHGIGGTAQHITGVANLTLHSNFDNDFSFDLQALVIDVISGNLPESQIDSASLDYLKNIPLSDLNWDLPGRIDMLLGAENFVKLVLKNNRVAGPPGLPDAIETVFGYVISGSALTTNPRMTSVQSFFTTTENVDSLLSKFWEIEEVPVRKHMSADDMKCEEIYVNHTTRDSQGRYMVPLPFQRSPESLGDSLPTATRRYNALEKRFKQDNTIHKQYDEIIRDYLKQQYISPVSESNDELPSYIIPHHPVIRADKLTTKVRLVLDASARTTTKLSLNDCLFTGPNLQSDLLTIIFHFRLFPIAITADIRQMYLRILVSPEFHRYLRILYRFSDESEPQMYEFNRVCFGLKCSPYLAMRTVKKLIEDEGHDFPHAAAIAARNLYMDDLGTSVMDEDTAISLSRDLINLFLKAELELVKFSSNSRALLDSLPLENRLASSVNISDTDELKILGLRWCPVEDQFSITVNLDPENIVTKRTILSTVAKLWDLVGIAAPIILYAKLLIKSLWLLKLDWDEQPPVKVRSQWLRFKSELPLLGKLKIPRHLGIDSDKCELILVGFADASTVAYGAVVYLCVIHPDYPHNKVNIVCAKSKVAPVKVITLARLELCAAVLLAKLMRYVADSISDKCVISKMFAFTDSSVTLHWIHSAPYRFNVFVSNRISQIHDYLPANNFYHVSGKENPCDCLSRGLTPSQLLNHPLWLQGPAWTKQPLSEWPLDHFKFNNDLIVPEIKTSAQTFLVTDGEQPFLYKLAERFSSWFKFLRVVVYVFRFINKIPRSEHITPADLIYAENAIIRAVQSVHFKNEIKMISQNKLPTKPLRQFSPFLENEILRVGGRLNKSQLDYSAKHPVLLPSNDHIVNLIVDAYHSRYLHPGPNLLMSLLRQKYWIMSCRKVVRKRFRLCLRCFKANPRTDYPLMADLPICRVTQTKPFLNTGVDYAGPIPILISRYRGARQQKAYICLFICLATRCTHIELATDLTASAFINAFKRFISRRGTCHTLYSDNGTNFVGAKSHFDEISELTNSKPFKTALSAEMLNHGITFKFNPPCAPHFGGSWESNIRSIKLHLKRVIGDQLLTYEEMLTVLTQIEALLNSRPLTLLTSDPSEPTALTPAHFLTLGPLNSLHNVDTVSLPLNLVKRKFLLDKIIQSFWGRWKTEYLHTLQARQKWNTPTNPITKGTVVLVNSDHVPPLKWPLGVIEDVFPGKDGIIRVVSVRTNSGTYQRPAVKVSPLPTQ